MTDILEGVRILDFSQEIQGPWGTGILADMGADVIKVERRETGELARGGGLRGHPELQGVSPYFTVFNRGKKSITLDLKQPSAREIIYRLAPTCDVVVNNWRIGVLDRLGLGYEDLKRHRPDIIFVNATTYGPRGPWAERPGRDTLGQAAGGLMYVNGPADGTPLAVGALVADQTAGMVEALAILAALQYRTRTGRGQIVNTSLYGTVIAMQAWEITQRSMAKETIGRHRAHCFALRGPWGAFKTADGYICLAGVQPRLFPAFCRALGIEEHAAAYDSIDAMYRRADELEALLDHVFPTRTTAAWLATLEPLDILVSPVQSYDEIIASEQARANGYIVPLEHPALGTLEVVGVPVSMSEAEIKPRGVPPEVGQHTEEVLLSLGYTWEELEELRTGAVI